MEQGLQDALVWVIHLESTQLDETAEKIVLSHWCCDLRALLCNCLCKAERLKALLKLLNDGKADDDSLVDRHLLQHHYIFLHDNRHELF